MGMEDVKDNKEYNFEKLVYRVMWTVAIIVSSAIGLYWGHFGSPLPLNTLGTIADFGAFGDFFGGLTNPLLQFIVITMLFWSIQVQRKELQATRDTLDATKVELLETKEANKIQAIELEKQTKILLTQQQDSLDHIRVEQELELLKRQRAILEGFFSKKVVVNNGYSIRSILGSKDHKVISDSFRFFDETSEEWILGRRISDGLQLFSTGLCGLLKCKNIPLSSALVEIRWLAEISNDLVHIKVIKNKLVISIEENIINRIEESSLSKENKVFFRDNLSHKYSN